MATFFISISNHYKDTHIARAYPLFISGDLPHYALPYAKYASLSLVCKEYILIFKPNGLWKYPFVKYYRLMPAKGSLLQIGTLQHVPWLPSGHAHPPHLKAIRSRLATPNFSCGKGWPSQKKRFASIAKSRGMRMHSNGWTTLSLPIPRFARNHLFTLHRFIQTETVTCSYALGRTRKLRTKFTAETIKEKRLNKIYLLKKWQQVYHASCPASREQGSLVLNFKAL